MFTKIKNKLATMSTKDWIALSLWMLTLVILVVFVGIAAGMPHTGADAGSAAYANALAATGLVLAMMLIAAMFTTVWFSYKKKKGGK